MRYMAWFWLSLAVLLQWGAWHAEDRIGALGLEVTCWFAIVMAQLASLRVTIHDKRVDVHTIVSVFGTPQQAHTVVNVSDVEN